MAVERKILAFEKAKNKCTSINKKTKKLFQWCNDK